MMFPALHTMVQIRIIDKCSACTHPLFLLGSPDPYLSCLPFCRGLDSLAWSLGKGLKSAAGPIRFSCLPQNEWQRPREVARNWEHRAKRPQRVRAEVHENGFKRCEREACVRGGGQPGETGPQNTRQSGAEMTGSWWLWKAGKPEHLTRSF